MSQDLLEDSDSEFLNKYDNSDLQLKEGKKEIAQLYASNAEMLEYQQYLKTLILESQALQNNSNTLVIDPVTGEQTAVPLASVIAPRSDYENHRKMVIIRLNSLAAGDKDEKAELRRLMANFGTDSIWLLSSKITNILVAKQRKDKIVEDFFDGAEPDTINRYKISHAISKSQQATRAATRAGGQPGQPPVSDA